MLKRISTYELPALLPADASSDLRFVIETLRDLETGDFLARLSRRELFRLASGPSATTLSDEDIVVEDAFWDWQAHRYLDEAEAVEALLSALAAQLDSDKLRRELEAFRRNRGQKPTAEPTPIGASKTIALRDNATAIRYIALDKH